MNKLIIYGVGGVIALGGIYIVSKSRGASPPQAQQSAPPAQPLFYASGLGNGGTPSNATPAGGTDLQSFAATMAASMTTKSNNDLTLGLAQTKSNTDIALANINNDYNTSFLKNIPILSGAGISGLSNTSADGKNISGIIYSDPTKNVAYGSGYNERGDLTGVLPNGILSIISRFNSTPPTAVPQVDPVAPVAAPANVAPYAYTPYVRGSDASNHNNNMGNQFNA